MSASSPETLPVIASKTLPSALHLPEQALSPTTPSLVVLTSAPDAVADPKVVLYRLTQHGAELVWEWTPPPPPAAPAPAGKFGGLGLKGKAKAQVNAGKVEQTVWSPDGEPVTQAFAKLPPILMTVHHQARRSASSPRTQRPLPLSRSSRSIPANLCSPRFRPSLDLRTAARAPSQAGLASLTPPIRGSNRGRCGSLSACPRCPKSTRGHSQRLEQTALADLEGSVVLGLEDQLAEEQDLAEVVAAVAASLARSKRCSNANGRKRHSDH